MRRDVRRQRRTSLRRGTLVGAPKDHFRRARTARPVALKADVIAVPGMHAPDAMHFAVFGAMIGGDLVPESLRIRRPRDDAADVIAFEWRNDIEPGQEEHGRKQDKQWFDAH